MQHSSDITDEVIDLRAWIVLLWNGRWLAIGVISLCLLCGIGYGVLAKKWFLAEVVSIQADNKSLPSGLAQIGGLASLAGINIGTGTSSQAPIAVLRSREFAREFIEDEHLLPVLLIDKWDAKAGKWRPSIFGGPPPDIRDAVRFFDRNVRTISEDKKTGLVTLSILWTDPEAAARWANLLMVRANARLRDRALSEADHNITYLKDELAATNIPQLQQSIGRTLENEMQKFMLAKGNEEFAFKIVDHAIPPKRKAKPQWSIVIFSSIAIGTILSTALLWWRNSRVASRRVQDRSV